MGSPVDEEELLDKAWVKLLSPIGCPICKLVPKKSHSCGRIYLVDKPWVLIKLVTRNVFGASFLQKFKAFHCERVPPHSSMG